MWRSRDEPELESFTNLPHTTLHTLDPTPASDVSKYTAAAGAEVAAGFLTPADASAAMANAQAGHGPLQSPPSTIPCAARVAV